MLGRGLDVRRRGNGRWTERHAEALAQIVGLKLRPAAGEKLLYKNAEMVFKYRQGTRRR